MERAEIRPARAGHVGLSAVCGDRKRNGEACGRLALFHFVGNQTATFDDGTRTELYLHHACRRHQRKGPRPWEYDRLETWVVAPPLSKSDLRR